MVPVAAARVHPPTEAIAAAARHGRAGRARVSPVAALPGDRRSATLAEAILALAEKLGLRVVAEGVETREQLELLRHRGCREMQGFRWSPALAPDDFLALLRQGLPIRT